jgi:hypothetical protein
MSEQVKQEGTFKVKLKKPKQLTKSDEPIKIDLSKPKTETDAIQVGKTEKVVVEEQTGDSPKVDEQVSESSPVSEIKEEEVKPIEKVVEEEIVQLGEKIEEKVIAPTPEEVREVAKLPENIEKVVDFMKETGGTLEDYVRLNADYSNVDNDTLLREYYKQAKSHLDLSEINFMIEDNFSYDEEVDEEREIRKKKLAYKEEVAKAQKHLNGLKSKYYEEIKLRPGMTQDQQKLWTFSIAIMKSKARLNNNMRHLSLILKNIFLMISKVLTSTLEKKNLDTELKIQVKLELNNQMFLT